MHVAVVIVGYRNPQDISQCLAALARSRHADFRVVICENGGTEAFQALKAAIPAALPGGQPVEAHEAIQNLGYAGGVNFCILASSDADAWWILNPDTEPEPEALAALVERLSQGDCEAVGGVLVLPNGQVQSYGGLWRSWLARAVSLGYGASPAQIPDAAQIERRQNYLSGASMLVSRRFVAAAGLMREDYFLYCEEVEWSLRAREKGMRLGAATAARVLHKQGTTTGSAVEFRSRPALSVFLNERNRLLLTRDCFAWRLPGASLAALLLLIARYGRRRAWRQLRFAFDGWLAGLLDQRGPVNLV